MYVLNAAAEVYLMSSRQFKIALRDVNKKKYGGSSCFLISLLEVSSSPGVDGIGV
jgi:hypothetical protein